MSDYRFAIVDHNGIPSVYVAIDGLETDENGAEVCQTHIPVDDIETAIDRFRAAKKEKKRLQFDFSEKEMQRLAHLEEWVDVPTKAEIVRKALVLYGALVDKAYDGYNFKIINSAGETVFALDNSLFRLLLNMGNKGETE